MVYAGFGVRKMLWPVKAKKAFDFCLCLSPEGWRVD
jgi:hypothetical protein